MVLLKNTKNAGDQRRAQLEKLKQRFSPKPYLKKETPIYNEEDHKRDSNKSYEPTKRHGEKLKKEHENK
ncbi:MAG: hypothetical protein ACOX2X_05820 [Peptococcia bacterium]